MYYKISMDIKAGTMLLDSIYYLLLILTYDPSEEPGLTTLLSEFVLFGLFMTSVFH